MKTRPFTEDQIRDAAPGAKKGEKPIEELCRDFGCSPASYDGWKKEYGETSVDKARRLRPLEKENLRLLRIVGEQRLEIDALKGVIQNKR